MSMALPAVTPLAASSGSQVANFVIESIRFRLNLDKDGQYRFGDVHFAMPRIQQEFGQSVGLLMAGRTVREILAEMGQFREIPPAVAEALQSFLRNLQPVIA